MPGHSFLGFDSRLSVRPAGRLPDGGDTPLAFEIVGGKPAVAFARELVILDGKQDLRLPLPFQATGILADGSATLIATSAGGVFEFGPSGWVRTDRFPAALAASLHNSGAPLPLVTLWDARTTGFLAFQTSASSFPIARIEGQLHAVSWNAGGLAAIVGDSLVIWRAGGNELRTLRTDTALAESRDICLLGEGRALVSARRGVYLVTAGNTLPVLGAPAWCRYSGGRLYVLDAVNRMVWAVSGEERIGQPVADREYALKLLAEAAGGSSGKDAKYLEASRILGCQEARRQMASLHR